YPTANAASSTAAIANNTNLPGGRPLAINENGGAWMLTNTSNTASPPIGLGKPAVLPIPRDTSAPLAGSPPPAAPKVMPIPSTDSGTGNPIVAAGSWTTPSFASASAA